MCNIGIVLGDAGVKLPTAILFMNSNKSERNIRKKVAKAREKCMSQGIVLGHDVVINKGPDRDIDRDAVNMLITFLLDGEYQMIVVDKLTDLTSDLSDLEEFLNDAAAIGVSVFELSTMQIGHHVYMEGCPDCSAIGKIINLRS
ncbi:hypothetical protein DW775_08030 [Agathobacter rectalis]|jgi:hypothetical protein|uniref:Resolvase/invertase-type recombinase catalytic domain-containing protein n=1 Tax=Agathobacter rectalis TaxID=39491 RepID=A0A413BKJ5_9FIRM|nr:hypothetical protein [Agathobacter rectalis]RGW41405.1 hypothetical protein DWV78_00845 [Agathobacter rectalis]RHD94696.1 hypothetical protein DW775_08030 [Agathobacter rectalis]